MQLHPLLSREGTLQALRHPLWRFRQMAKNRQIIIGMKIRMLIARNRIPLLKKIQSTNTHILEISQLDLSDKQTDFDSETLLEIFKECRTQKGFPSAYHLEYAKLAPGNRQKVGRVLEFGIGSSDSEILSNVGGSTPIGASLRAWKAFFPMAEVIGADIDPKTMFSETRIQTFVVNQLSLNSLMKLRDHVGYLDLISIDGLHEPLADLNTLVIFLPMLSINGMCVIEDFSPPYYDFWEIAKSQIPDNFSSYIRYFHSGTCLVIRRNS